VCSRIDGVGAGALYARSSPRRAINHVFSDPKTYLYFSLTSPPPPFRLLSRIAFNKEEKTARRPLILSAARITGIASGTAGLECSTKRCSVAVDPDCSITLECRLRIDLRASAKPNFERFHGVHLEEAGSGLCVIPAPCAATRTDALRMIESIGLFMGNYFWFFSSSIKRVTKKR
jgi:hypothetical protein